MMQGTNYSMIAVVLCLGLGISSADTEVETSPLSQGNCLDGWVDGSSVEMGCLYFNTTDPMTWLESVQSCKAGTTNGYILEILSPQQMDFVKTALWFLEDEVFSKYKYFSLKLKSKCSSLSQHF